MSDWTAYPTAVTGTWFDVEDQAAYIYANADKQSTEYKLAEAVLVLLRHWYEARVKSWELLGR